MCSLDYWTEVARSTVTRTLVRVRSAKRVRGTCYLTSWMIRHAEIHSPASSTAPVPVPFSLKDICLQPLVIPTHRIRLLCINILLSHAIWDRVSCLKLCPLPSVFRSAPVCSRQHYNHRSFNPVMWTMFIFTAGSNCFSLTPPNPIYDAREHLYNPLQWYRNCIGTG